MSHHDSAVRDNGLLTRLTERVVASLGQRFVDWQPEGSISVTFPSGRTLSAGIAGAEPAAQITINRFRVLWRSMMRATNGFADSYMDGDVDIEDLFKLFVFFLRNEKNLNQSGKGIFHTGGGDRQFHTKHRNTISGSRENIHAHYDLGNKFYSLWLDESMTYSSAYFEDGAKTLKQAQDAKYRNICDQLGLRQGDRVLEIGCGWGGFAEFAAANYGAHVTGITISEEQLAFARERLDKAGLSDRTDIRFLDYRKTEGEFDHIASIEMIEAVGEEFWPAYFETVADRLKPGGKAAIQAITIDEPFFEGYRSNVDFIQRYIFPGGMLLTDRAIRENAKRHGMTTELPFLFGKSYARTLRQWHERFMAAWPQIEPLGFDERFKRMWKYYLAYCEAGFEEKRIDLGLYLLQKPA